MHYHAQSVIFLGQGDKVPDGPDGKRLSPPIRQRTCVRIWKSLNRLRAQVGRCKQNLVKWGIIDPSQGQCECGALEQTMPD